MIKGKIDSHLKDSCTTMHVPILDMLVPRALDAYVGRGIIWATKRRIGELIEALSRIRQVLLRKSCGLLQPLCIASALVLELTL